MIVKGIIIYYIVVSVLAFFLYGIDKSKAKKGKWRIPEKTLFGIAFLGGGVGALLGMEIFRHKTKHMSFCILVPLAIALHVGLIIYLVREGILTF